MDAVFRATAIYLFLLFIFRVAGKHSLAQITTFDFVLLLIISETTQSALLGDDFSVTNAFVLICTLVTLNVIFTIIKQRWQSVDKLLEGVPIIIVDNGRPDKAKMQKARLDEADILMAARETQGLERMEQIKYAVLERSGGISIIPKEQN